MKRLVVLMVGLFFSLSLFAGPQDNYKEAGKELMAQISSGKVDMSKARASVDVMVGAGVELFDVFVKKHADGKKLLDYVKSELSKIKTARLDSLEKDYHDAGKLPASLVGVDLKSEDGEMFTDPLHVVLHPLMTLRAIEANDLKTAKEELNEGLEQVQNVVNNSK